jgi:hypothetical protein
MSCAPAGQAASPVPASSETRDRSVCGAVGGQCVTWEAFSLEATAARSAVRTAAVMAGHHDSRLWGGAQPD